MFAVDRHTGALVWSTQVDTDPAAVITSSPAVYRGVAYLGISTKGEAGGPGTFRGAVIALDAANGTLLWKTCTLPSNNGNSDSGKPGYYSGNAVWSSTPVIDPRRGLLYAGTGNNCTVPAGVCTAPGQTGCTQPAAGEYLDSILALKLSDGTVAWADHTLDTDLWTVPQPSGPDFDYAGSLAAAGTDMYALDAATGTILWSFASGGGGHLKKWVRALGNRRPSTSMSVFSL